MKNRGAFNTTHKTILIGWAVVALVVITWWILSEIPGSPFGILGTVIVGMLGFGLGLMFLVATAVVIYIFTADSNVRTVALLIVPPVAAFGVLSLIGWI